MSIQRSGSSALLPYDLEGRRAVVTGAARGIGLAIALQLARAGARVIALDKDKESLVDAVSGREWDGLDVIPVEQDLGESKQVDPRNIAETLTASGAPIELIVNNVGVCSGTGLFDTGFDDFDRVLRTNLRNPWFLTMRLVEELIGVRRSGSVLFISSLHEEVVSRRPQYSISKAGLSMAVRELAAALGPHGIRVNAISPGWISSVEPPDLSKSRRLLPQIPLRRPGAPDDVAKLALFLLSDTCAGYLTGVNIPIDGGLLLRSWVPESDADSPLGPV
jgi:2-deoxy-D-gluconate 3-dehydrogenase